MDVEHYFWEPDRVKYILPLKLRFPGHPTMERFPSGGQPPRWNLLGRNLYSLEASNCLGSTLLAE